MNAEREAAIRARLAAATPGPWAISDGNEGTSHASFWEITNEAFRNPPADEDAPWIAVELHTGVRADADLIANAPADLAHLLTLMDRQATALDAVRELLADWDERWLMDQAVIEIRAALAAADDGGTRGRRSAARPGDRLSRASDGDQGDGRGTE